MALFLFFLILFIVLVGGGWRIGKSFGNFLFPGEKENRNVFIDKSVHHHHHEHKHINIIDDKTKEEIIVYQKTITSKK
jgi:hypothetical protein